MGVTAVKKPEASHLFLTDLLFRCIWLSQKEKDLKAKSGRTDHRLDRPFPFLPSLLAHLSPCSLSLSHSHRAQPLGFHASLDSPTSASHLASPLRTGSASYLRARPAAMLALVAARQRTQAAEAVGTTRQCSAERREAVQCRSVLLRVHCYSAAAALPLAPRCTSSAGRCTAVQTVRGEWR